MPRNIQILPFQAIAAPVAGALATKLPTGPDLSVQFSPEGVKIVAWHALHNSVTGFQRLLYNSGHDQTLGLKEPVAPGQMGNIIGRGMALEVQTEEALRVTIGGTAGAGTADQGYFLMEYADLPGMGGRYIGFDTLERRREPGKDINIYATIAPGAVAGFGTEEPINAENDVLWGGREYALRGITTSANVMCVYIVGPDTGNTKIGCPGNAVDDYPRGNDYFCELSRTQGRPFIPIFNASNAKNTNIGFIHDQTLIGVTVALHLSLLKLSK